MEFAQPFRLTSLATGCTFMVAPVDPEIPSKGTEGEKTRVKGLTNLTYATINDAKTSKGIGILVSKDGGYTQIDWSFPKTSWKFDPQMEARLSTGDLFRKTAEKIIDNFLSLGWYQILRRNLVIELLSQNHLNNLRIFISAI